ncbi:MAG: dimethylsulfonioproprionate lyase family protein [Pseudomonadota bacterium]
MDPPYDPRQPPESVPATGLIDEMTASASPSTEVLVREIAAAAPLLPWKRTYDAGEVGAAFLAAYGWFDLLAPGGPFLWPDRRIAIAYFGRGLTYPRHAHKAEEIYAPLAGRALFMTDGQRDETLGPGGTRHHPPGVPHAMRMGEAPLLTLVIWKGAGLTGRAHLSQDGSAS